MHSDSSFEDRAVSALNLRRNTWGLCTKEHQKEKTGAEMLLPFYLRRRLMMWRHGKMWPPVWSKTRVLRSRNCRKTIKSIHTSTFTWWKLWKSSTTFKENVNASKTRHGQDSMPTSAPSLSGFSFCCFRLVWLANLPQWATLHLDKGSTLCARFMDLQHHGKNVRKQWRSIWKLHQRCSHVRPLPNHWNRP